MIILPSTPPLFHRERMLWLAGFVALLLVGPVGVGVWAVAPGRAGLALVSTMILCGISTALVLYSDILSRRRMSRIAECDCLVCGCCSQTLVGTPAACPECGATVDVSRLRGFWMRYIRQHRRQDPDGKGFTPLWLRRLGRKGFAGSMLFTVAVLGLLIGGRSLMPWPSPLLGISMMSLVPFSFLFAGKLVSWHACRRVVQFGGMACTDCGGLVADPGDGTRSRCCRCGRLFLKSELLDKWAHWQPACWAIERVQKSAPDAATHT